MMSNKVELRLELTIDEIKYLEDKAKNYKLTVDEFVELLLADFLHVDESLDEVFN